MVYEVFTIRVRFWLFGARGGATTLMNATWGRLRLPLLLCCFVCLLTVFRFEFEGCSCRWLLACIVRSLRASAAARRVGSNFAEARMVGAIYLPRNERKTVGGKFKQHVLFLKPPPPTLASSSSSLFLAFAAAPSGDCHRRRRQLRSSRGSRIPSSGFFAPVISSSCPNTAEMLLGYVLHSHVRHLAVVIHAVDEGEGRVGGIINCKSRGCSIEAPVPAITSSSSVQR